MLGYTNVSIHCTSMIQEDLFFLSCADIHMIDRHNKLQFELLQCSRVAETGSGNSVATLATHISYTLTSIKGGAKEEN